MKAEDWDQLPPRCLFQMHAHCTPDMVDQLTSCGFRVVTLARHPLDVLISILHFALFEPEVARWLEGESGNEQELLLALPNSKEFLGYACGSRAKTLLQVSLEWWNQTGCIHLRYEDLVADTGKELRRIVDFLEWKPDLASVHDVVEQCSMESLRKTASNNHFWKGKPGGWRLWLTAQTTQAIARAHPDVFERLGYDAQANPSLRAETANSEWLKLVQTEWWKYLGERESVHHRLAQLGVAYNALQAENQRLHQVVNSRSTAPPAVHSTFLQRVLRRLRRPLKRAA
ncbi:MAG: sulfotransferase domain-containing protein [Gemmataceae bacterium]